MTKILIDKETVDRVLACAERCESLDGKYSWSDIPYLMQQALEQSTEQYIAVAWDTKEMWLKSWLPRLKEALNDVRNKENSSAEEALYELYVEMNQQTLSEKVDTLSEMQTEDLLSSTVAELLETRKRLSEVENILCRQHFEQSTEQEPVTFRHYLTGEFCTGGFKRNEVDKWIPLYTQPPQHVLMASYYKELAAQEYKRGYADAMNWKVQNHLEHLPEKGEAAPRKPLTDEEIDRGLVRTNYAMQTAGAWREGVEWAQSQLKEKNT